MSGKRVLALYAAVLLGFAVVLCRLYFLAENHTYAARAEAQSTVRLSLPARRGSFYDHSGLLLTGLETRHLALCFPGENNYTRLYAFTDSAGQALLYRNRNRSAPFLLEVDRDLSGRGIRCFATARRCAEVPLCQHLMQKAAALPGWKRRWTASWPGQRSMTRWCARSQHKDGCGPGKHRSSPGRTAVRWACS